MSKLFAFGDSHAYGQGMPDCWIDEKVPGPEHSKLSWPSVLGGMLGKEVINLSKAGLSNKGIVHQLRLNKQQISSNDVVCIGWSYTERHMVITSQGRNRIEQCNHMGPWNKFKRAKLYYKYIWENVDATVTSEWYIEFADLIIKNIGAKVIHFPTPNSTPNSLTMDIADGIIYSNLDLQDHEIDKANDNAHAGPKSHKKFSEAVMKEYGDYLK
jgi:hypothetical protein